jgi:hypothetical protein
VRVAAVVAVMLAAATIPQLANTVLVGLVLVEVKRKRGVMASLAAVAVVVKVLAVAAAQLFGLFLLAVLVVLVLLRRAVRVAAVAVQAAMVLRQLLVLLAMVARDWKQTHSLQAHRFSKAAAVAAAL